MSMEMRTSLQQRQELRLKLAPQIIQSIEILQIATLKLQDVIRQEMETNPTIEMTVPGIQLESEVAPEERAREEQRDRELESDFAKLEGLESAWREFSSNYRPQYFDEGKDRKLEAMQNTAARPASLLEYLVSQLGLQELPERESEIAEEIIYNIDDAGYVRYPLPEVVEAMNTHGLEGGNGDKPNPPVSLEEAEAALKAVQRLDPPGVGARDLKECLHLQLARGSADCALEHEIIEKHLDDITMNRLPKIAKETGADMDTIKEAVDLIKCLHPKPGTVFTSEQVQYITPDVVVESIDGKWEVRLEDTYIPRIHISQHYQKMLEQQKDNPAVKDFIKKKIESARWLIESIEQRQNTLFKIANEMVHYQEPFLEHGIDFLRPLKMQYIADRVGVHVSTVSRAIADKYIQTPRGIFPLKFFFTGGTVRADGESESIVAVKQRVRDIVSKEEKRHPLSDEEIAAKLKEAGLDIARRTVTKYRKQLKIPSSRQRREY